MSILAETTSQAPIRVLVADDEATIRDSYREILQTKDPENATRNLDEMRTRLFGTPKTSSTSADRFELTFCRGAEDAVQAVKDGNIDGRPYSVIFLDMRMPPGPDGLWATIKETGLEASALEIEITENVLMKDGEMAITTLQELKSLGVQRAIDDFGTGYSSLAYLKKFPIDRLMIGRSFVGALSTDLHDRAIASAVISLAENMNLSVTAEGVETENQFDFLKSRNCDEVQGYYLSRPLPVDEMSEFMHKRSTVL